MVQFSKLKLTGFKSFSDSTEIDILDGLTGVIGPNGCGKSNLVESLRWIMGENSPKNMRGGAMDDIIFAGTGKRPPRNFAEVILTLDNKDKKAPEAFNNDDTLEISRRIERGMGSDYRINGKLVRAADVKMFFADTATGAHSPAIVSQGRVADLIQAKPTDRRMVLEEAAAISGLHSRRKEAEQRLRAGEKNLLRLDDLMGGKESLYESLKKQARQAVRYKKLSDTIRRLEASMILVEWQNLTQEAQATKERLTETNNNLNAAKQALFDLQKNRDTLQQNQKQARAELETVLNKKRALDLEKDKTQDKLNQLDEKKRALEEQQQQALLDFNHEQETLEQATEKLSSLEREKNELEKTVAHFDDDFTTTLNTRDETKQKFDDANNALSQRKSSFAAQQTQRQYLQDRLETLTQSQKALADQIDNVHALLANEKQKAKHGENEEKLRLEVSRFEKDLEKDQTTLSEKQEQLNALSEQQKETQKALEQASSAVTTLETEHKALHAILDQSNDATDFTSVMDDITVEHGFETALGVALGTDLQAGLDESAPFYWAGQNTLKTAPLPTGAICLLDVVKAPKSLHIALSQIGIVVDQNQGQTLAKSLSPGQVLVTKDGYAWRWDGLTVTPAAKSILQSVTAEERLKQRNRLSQIENDLKKAQEKRARIQADYDGYRSDKENLETVIKQLRQTIDQGYTNLNQKREAVTRHIQESAENQSTIKALEDQITHLNQRQKDDEAQLSKVTEELKTLPHLERNQDEINTLEEQLTTLEEAYQTAQEAYLTLKGNVERSKQRLQTIDHDLEEWANRKDNAIKRLDVLSTRQGQSKTALASLTNAPEELQKHLENVTAKIAQQQEHVTTVEDSFNKIDLELNTLNHSIEEQQETLSNCREAMARDETRFQANQEATEQLGIRCQQQFSLAPKDVAAKFDIDLEEDHDDLDTMRIKFERYRNERERIGAVNLRAEEEAQELSKEIETIITERQDVMAAIEELRQAIAKLNRDARKKMVAAFEEVNTNFQSIFKRLFIGGEAHLELIDAEDPLNAGLEIYASPPGKRMQNLSLLSGGEQSLTAIALIFAMFLTTPSPICILDEIDAPLDDANVERICTLLNDFTNDPEITTRFLVITHNPITMAHVDRLYGVTMAEKGVSKLVSVDLDKQKQEAEENQPEQLALA